MSEKAGAEVFHATAAQWRLYGCLHQQATPQPLAATLAGAHVSISSYYRWLKQPGFIAWLSAAWLESKSAPPIASLLSLGALPAAAGETRFLRPALALLLGPYGIANLLPPLPSPTRPSRASRAPSPLSRLFRFHRYFTGTGADANFTRISRTGLFRRPPLRFQSPARKKEH